MASGEPRQPDATGGSGGSDPRDATQVWAPARALRLARQVTGRPYAGIAFLGSSASSASSATDAAMTLGADHPLVRAVLQATGVHEDDGDLLAPPWVRSFAGIRLDGAAGSPLAVLWVAGEVAGTLGAGARQGLADLAALLAAELERSNAIGVAGEVQRQLLPARAPEAPGYDLAAACHPALEVGGDFYDWWRAGDSLRLVLADVMGKGLSAAIVAAAVRAMLRAALSFHEPAAALSRVAGDLQSDLDHVARFATCFAAHLDLATGRLDYADAGHGLGVVLRADGSHGVLDSEDPPLGALPGSTWRAQRTVLAPGDTMLVVSDGVLDRFQSRRDAVSRALELHRSGAVARTYVDALTTADAWDRSGDDLTVVAIRREP